MSCSMKRIVIVAPAAARSTRTAAALSRRRDPGRRLVEQQDARPRRQRQRDLQQPLLAVGQLARQRRRVAGELQRSQQLARLVERRALAPPPVRHHIADRGPRARRSPAPPTPARSSRGKSVLIWNVRVMPALHARVLRQTPVMRSPPRIHLAAVGAQHAGEQVDERRLARAVGADQRVARAGLERPATRRRRRRRRRSGALESRCVRQRWRVSAFLCIAGAAARRAPPSSPPRANSTSSHEHQRRARIASRPG